MDLFSLIVAAFTGTSSRRPLGSSRQALANAVGLRSVEAGRWVGSRGGFQILVEVADDPRDPFSVRAPLPFGTPEGFRLGPAALSRDPRLLWPAVATLIDAIDARDWRVEIGAEVHVQRPAVGHPVTPDDRRSEIDEAIDRVVALLRALDARYRELTGPTVREPTTVLGPLLGHDAWSLEVRSPLGSPLPPGTTVTARRSARGGSLGDLVLDHALSASASDLGALGRRLARDEVRGPLLDVLASHPGSELLEDEVLHVVDDGALDVAAAVHRVEELVAALGGHPPDSASAKGA